MIVDHGASDQNKAQPDTHRTKQMTHPGWSTPAMLVQTIIALTASLLSSSMNMPHKGINLASTEQRSQSHPESQKDPYNWTESQSMSVGEADEEVEPQTWTSRAHKQSLADCLHAALSALMNLTHNNETGCSKTEDAGGPEAVATLLIALSCTPCASPVPQDGRDVSNTATAQSAAAGATSHARCGTGNHAGQEPGRQEGVQAAAGHSQGGSSFFMPSQSADAPDAAPEEMEAAVQMPPGSHSQSHGVDGELGAQQPPLASPRLCNLLKVRACKKGAHQSHHLLMPDLQP